MKTEHGMGEVPVDAGMKKILPDQSLHHNTRKHLGQRSVQNMDQTDCVFSERKNVEQQLPERLHIKEEPETLSEGQEENQLCRQQETNSAACLVKCEDEEEKPEASQLHWRQQTETNIKEEPSTCTLDELMKRQTVEMNSKGPESARNPDPSSLVLQGTDGTTTDSSYTEDDDDDDDDDDSLQKPLLFSENEANDFYSSRNETNMSDSSVAACVSGNGLTLIGNMGEKPFGCDVCGTLFRNKGKLNRHMKVHTLEKPYSCDVCDKCYSQRTDLLIHMRVHTGEKPFVCDVCTKCFSRKTNYQAHMRRHSGGKPYVCTDCSKGFTQKNDLSRHMRTHMTEELFPCEVCNKLFKRKDKLNRHMRIHTGEKPFSCDFCGKCFSRRDEVISHTRVHTGEKPYICDVCTKGFSQKSTLTSHMKKVHPGK